MLLLEIERIVNNVPITYLYPNNVRVMCYPKSLTITNHLPPNHLLSHCQSYSVCTGIVEYYVKFNKTGDLFCLFSCK